MSSILYGVTHAQWATQSGLSGNYTISDHAHKALFDLTTINGTLDDMMFEYLRDTKSLTGSISDMVNAWDGVFGGGPSSGSGLLLVDGTSFLKLQTDDYLLLQVAGSGPSSDGLLLETGDYRLLETGDYRLLE